MAEILNLLFLDIAIEQQGSVFFLGLLLLVDTLEVFDEIVDLRDIQETSDYVGWLNESQGERVLLDST